MTERHEKDSLGEENVGASSSAKSLPRKSSHALPPWKVLLHRDGADAVEDVVKVLQKVTLLSKDAAAERVLEAQNQGVSLLLVTHQERAELYVEQFASCNVKVTAEPEA